MKTFILLVAVCIASTYAVTVSEEAAEACKMEVGIDRDADDTELDTKYADKIPCLRACIFKVLPVVGKVNSVSEGIEKLMKKKESTDKEIIDKLIKPKVEACKSKSGNDCEYWKCLDLIDILDSETLEKLVH